MSLRYDRRDRVFISRVILVHIIFFLLACCYRRIFMGDSNEYINEALNIKRNLFFYSGDPSLPINPEFMTQRQPLYPFLLLSVYLFVVNNWIVLLLQNVLSVLNIWYTRKVLLHLGYTPKYDWLLLLLIIAYPAQFINANTLAPDILLQTFSLLYFGNFIWLVQRKSPKYALRMSVFLVAGMIVKPVLYPFALVHVVVLVAVWIYQKQKIGNIAVAALIPVCAVLLYNSWNYERTGKFHFSSNQAFNAVYYYYPFFESRFGQDSAIKFLTAERAAIDSIPEYDARYDRANSRGSELLKANFLPYMAFHLKHSARILIEPGKAEMDLFTGRLTYERLYSKEQTGFYATWEKKGMSGMGDYIRSNPSLVFTVLVLLFNCFRLAGLLLFFFDKRIPRPVRLFALVFIGYFAVAAGPIANTRYFLPVSLIAISCAVLGYIGRFQKRVQVDG